MVICFFGDSLVNGVNDPEGVGWVGRLWLSARKQGHAWTCYNLGVRQHTSRNILERWRNETACRVMPDAPMRLVFSFGAADAVDRPGRPPVPVEESRQNLRTILENASNRFPVLMIGPPPVVDPDRSARIRQLTDVYKLECEALDVPFLNIFPELENSELYFNDLVSGDGVHPGAAGYAHIFGLVCDWSAWKAWFAKGD